MIPPAGFLSRLIFAVTAAAPFLAVALACRWISESLSIGFFAAGAAVALLGLAPHSLIPFRTYFAASVAPMSGRILSAAAGLFYFLALAPLSLVLRGPRARTLWFRAKSPRTSYWIMAKRP